MFKTRALDLLKKSIKSVEALPTFSDNATPIEKKENLSSETVENGRCVNLSELSDQKLANDLETYEILRTNQKLVIVDAGRPVKARSPSKVYSSSGFGQREKQRLQKKPEATISKLQQRLNQQSNQLYKAGVEAKKNKNYHIAESNWLAALAIQERTWGVKNFKVSRLCEQFANLLCDMAHENKETRLYTLEQVLSFYQRSLKIWLLLNPKSNKVAYILNDIANMYLYQSDYRKALEYYQKAKRDNTEEKSLPPSFISKLYSNIGQVHAFQGDYSEALRFYSLAEGGLSAGESSEKASILNRKANVYAYQSPPDYQKALDCYTQVLNIILPAVTRVDELLDSRVAVHETQSSEVAKLLRKIANIYSRLSPPDYEKSLAYCKRALELDKNDNHKADIHRDIANIHRFQGDYKQAGKEYKEALQIYQSKLNSSHPKLCKVEQQLALTYEKEILVTDSKEQEELWVAPTKLLKDLYDRHAVFLHDLSEIKNAYQLREYDKLIKDLCRFYRLQGKHDLAYEVYFNEAKRWNTFPFLGLRYLKKALREKVFLRPNDKEDADLHRLQAGFLMKQGRWPLALKALSKIPNSVRKEKDIEDEKSCKLKWEVEQQQLVDEDLVAQWQRCLDSQHEIEMLLFKNLRSNKSPLFLTDEDNNVESQLLSETVKNRITELIIKLRNILDQSMLRFARDCIDDKAAEPRQEMMFPFASSKAALINNWHNAKLCLPDYMSGSDLEKFLSLEAISNTLYARMLESKFIEKDQKDQQERLTKNTLDYKNGSELHVVLVAANKLVKDKQDRIKERVIEAGKTQRDNKQKIKDPSIIFKQLELQQIILDHIPLLKELKQDREDRQSKVVIEVNTLWENLQKIRIIPHENEVTLSPGFDCKLISKNDFLLKDSDKKSSEDAEKQKKEARWEKAVDNAIMPLLNKKNGTSSLTKSELGEYKGNWERMLKVLKQKNLIAQISKDEASIIKAFDAKDIASTDFSRESVRELLQSKKIGDLLKKSDLRDLVENEIPEIEKDCDKILEMLVTLGWINQVKDEENVDGQKILGYKLGQSLPSDTSQVLPHEMATFAQFLCPQLRLAEETWQKNLPKKRWLNKVPELKPAYDVLLKHQPFRYYYHGEGNRDAKAAGELPLWEQSWLDTLVAIANDSKHVRLPPQKIQERLSGKQGLIADRDTRIFIEYIESRGIVYSWTFVPELFDIEPVEHRLELSRKVYGVLRSKENEFLTSHKGQIIPNSKHAGPFTEAVRKRADSSSILAEQKIFIEKVTAVLKVFPQLNPFQCERIAVLLLRRACQSAQLHFIPDREIDLHHLLHNSLISVREIIVVLGQARSKSLTSSQFVSKQREIKGVSKDLEASYQNCRAMETRANDFLQEYKLTEAIAVYEEESKVLLPRVQQLSHKRMAWLAGSRLSLTEKRVAAFKQRAHYYKTKKLWHPSYHYAQKAFFSIPQRKDRQSQDKECKDILNDYKRWQEKTDSDLRSQLEHVMESVDFLYEKIWKAANPQASKWQRLDVENRVAEVLVKMHHLLDQGITRWINHRPGNKDFSQFKYPCRGEYSSLIAWAIQCGLIEEADKQRKISEQNKGLGEAKHEQKELQEYKEKLEKQHPKVWPLIVATQPFHDPVTKISWLEIVISLSNASKHARLPSINWKEFEKGISVEKSSLFYLPHRLYEWSFYPTLSKEQSSEFYKALLETWFKGDPGYERLNFEKCPDVQTLVHDKTPEEWKAAKGLRDKIIGQLKKEFPKWLDHLESRQVDEILTILTQQAYLSLGDYSHFSLLAEPVPLFTYLQDALEKISELFIAIYDELPEEQDLMETALRKMLGVLPRTSSSSLSSSSLFKAFQPGVPPNSYASVVKPRLPQASASTSAAKKPSVSTLNDAFSGSHKQEISDFRDFHFYVADGKEQIFGEKSIAMSNACLFDSVISGVNLLRETDKYTEIETKGGVTTAPIANHLLLRQAVLSELKRRLASQDPGLKWEVLQQVITAATEEQFKTQIGRDLTAEADLHYDRGLIVADKEAEAVGQAYIKEMEKQTTWGGHLELAIISELLHIQIKQYEHSASGDFICHMIGAHHQSTVHVFYTDSRDHYNLLVPIADAKAVSKPQVKHFEDEFSSDFKQVNLSNFFHTLAEVTGYAEKEKLNQQLKDSFDQTAIKDKIRKIFQCIIFNNHAVSGLLRDKEELLRLRDCLHPSKELSPKEREAIYKNIKKYFEETDIIEEYHAKLLSLVNDKATLALDDHDLTLLSCCFNRSLVIYTQLPNGSYKNVILNEQLGEPLYFFRQKNQHLPLVEKHIQFLEERIEAQKSKKQASDDGVLPAEKRNGPDDDKSGGGSSKRSSASSRPSALKSSSGLGAKESSPASSKKSIAFPISSAAKSKIPELLQSGPVKDTVSNNNLRKSYAEAVGTKASVSAVELKSVTKKM